MTTAAVGIKLHFSTHSKVIVTNSKNSEYQGEEKDFKSVLERDILY